MRPILLYYRKEEVIIPETTFECIFCSLCLLRRKKSIISDGSQTALMSLVYKRTLYGLSTGKVLEGVWLGRGKFMGCEGQFEQPADGVQKPAMSPFSLYRSPIER